MLFRSSVVAAATLLTMAQAQYNIDPDSVPIADREQWCRSQVASCPLICEQTKPGTTLVNDCDVDTLTYGCLCGDNKKPNISEYSLTIPYFVCREWGTQCVDNCPENDSKCASDCREDHPCGALNPKKVKPTTSTAGPSASQTDDATDVIYTDSPGSSEDDNGNGGDERDGASALALGQAHGLAVVLGSLFVGFAML
ncbi:hypothetical protein ACRE_090480 [Hapsidospora chrysogenum ATCC 11550]|uniref:DUF7707 domain-containing protein n=1 Tax=Hapsidospora chrysogenum (strain ATCC 11550 / CBS 779.69 / DSM 880 / IAM 14645 / JCM 23072 / IMI 49137) TaxID=857340 RepID=A0A086ST60_HAPC1|nr:hypothetical protein ACRE_090480 [Hapsidospora chrysogenum ATCC 11550]